MSRLLNALQGRNVGRPPVWLMRQAGRYQPQYRAMREKYPLLEMFRTPEMIADVTALPIDLVKPDAAILFSDILIVLDQLGVKWDVHPGVGPVIEVPNFDSLEVRPAAEAVPFVGEGIRLIRQRISEPLIGFCGAPFTVASYLVEGQGSKQLHKIRKLMYQQPEQFHKILQTICDAAADLIRFQVASGAQVIQVFDSWAHWLGPKQFEEFCYPYLKQLAEAVNVPVILFCRGPLAPLLARAGTAIGLDWHHDLSAARKALPNTPLQGNFDPCLLYASPAEIEREVKETLQAMEGDRGYIVNLGHGILPDTPMENVQVFVDCVRSHETCPA